MKNNYVKAVAFSAMLGAFMQSAQAHITFTPNNAYAGKSYVGTLNVGHGCEDVNAAHYDTVKIEVLIPPGFTGARPQDSVFGPATVEKDANGNVTKLIWTKAAGLPEDSQFYQVSFRGTLPDAAFTSLDFVTTQTCTGNTAKTWEGADAPRLRILPARAPGWNKYTAQANFDETAIKAFFGDAYIVWSNGAAYSVNPVTAGLIANKLTAIAVGSDIWVKY